MTFSKMIDLPDLSHLTPEEQEKIRTVIKRQQDEEEKEKDMLKVIHSQLEDYKKQVTVGSQSNGTLNNISPGPRPSPVTPQTPEAPCCELCMRTKFADGCGNDCIYCNKKICSRCGARIRIVTKDKKFNKTMWACNTCRKQQDILLKSGRSSMVPNIHPLISKNIKNEDEKKFVIEQFNSSTISKSPKSDSNQNGESYSLDSALRSGSDMTVDVISNGIKKTEPLEPLPDSKTEYTAVSTAPSNLHNEQPIINSDVINVNRNKSNGSTYAKKTITKSASNTSHISRETEPISKPNVDTTSPRPARTQSSLSINNYSVNTDTVNARIPQGAQQSPKIISKSRSSFINGAGSTNYTKHRTTPNKRFDKFRQRTNAGSPSNKVIAATSTYDSNVISCQSEPNLAVLDRNASGLSNSNQSNITLSEHQKRILKCLNQNYSISSSEEETPDYSSFDDAEKEMSISDDDYYVKRHAHHIKRKSHKNSHHFPQSRSRISVAESEQCTCSSPNMSLPQKRKETYSSQNNFENRNQVPPVSWQPSLDGKFLIGHLLLNKNAGQENWAQDANQSGVMLGLKVVGGKMTKVGRRGAFITKVKKGGLADIVGHLKPGDEVISWNGNCLQDASFDEVYDIILASKYDDIVELIVSRPIKDVPRIPETRLRHAAESSSCSLDSERKELEVIDTTPLKGLIQIKMCYDDATQQLYVTAIRAVELPLREGGLPRNPYLKMYLLPDRSNVFKRRTKTAKKTLCPEWNQTFVYSDVRREDLGAMALELSLWDYDRSLEANSKFMGEVMVDLGLVPLTDEPRWFKLMPLGYGMNQDYTMTNSMPKESMSMSVIQNMPTYNISPKMERASFINRSYKQQKYQTLPKNRHITSQSTNTISRRQLPNLPQEPEESPVFIKKPLQMSPRKTTPTTIDSNSVTNSGTESFSNKRTATDVSTTSVDKTLQTFVGGLGPGQVVGRQVLAVKSVGELECGLYERSGQLEIQIIRARNLLRKPGAKVQPATYVKVYLMFGLQCVAKKKTKLARRTVNPTYHQTLLFDPSQYGKSLQLIVWGDYGRMDNKVFMGVAQISLEGIDISSNVIGWYKLFPISSVVDASVLSLRKESSSSFGSSSHISSRDYSD